MLWMLLSLIRCPEGTCVALHSNAAPPMPMPEHPQQPKPPSYHRSWPRLTPAGHAEKETAHRVLDALVVADAAKQSMFDALWREEHWAALVRVGLARRISEDMGNYAGPSVASTCDSLAAARRSLHGAMAAMLAEAGVAARDSVRRFRDAHQEEGGACTRSWLGDLRDTAACDALANEMSSKLVAAKFLSEWLGSKGHEHPLGAACPPWTPRSIGRDRTVRLMRRVHAAALPALS